MAALGLGQEGEQPAMANLLQQQPRVRGRGEEAAQVSHMVGQSKRPLCWVTVRWLGTALGIVYAWCCQRLKRPQARLQMARKLGTHSSNVSTLPLLLLTALACACIRVCARTLSLSPQ